MSADLEEKSIPLTDNNDNNDPLDKKTGNADHHSSVFELFGSEWEEFPTFSDLQTKFRVSRQGFRIKLQDILNSIYLQTFILLLVIFDLILGFTNIFESKTESIITLIIIIIYIIEILLRIYAYGIYKYFTSILDILDFIAVIGSLILYIYSIYIVYTLLIKILRWIRVIRTSYRAIFSRSNKIQRAIRHLNKSSLIGYRDDKYNLDIAYITDHILIMSRPTSSQLNQFQHDPLDEIKAFLDEKHPNCYKIFDLCVYDTTKKDNNELSPKSGSGSTGSGAGGGGVPSNSLRDNNTSTLSLFSTAIPINIDINDAPLNEYNAFGCDIITNNYAFRGNYVLSLKKIFEFTEECTQYCDINKKNVVIIQSTTGLGRSMFMVACLLFYYYPSASLIDIMKFIQKERVDHNKNASGNDNDYFAKFLPSQTRYLRYFATLISHCYGLLLNKDNGNDDDEEISRALSDHMAKIQSSKRQSATRKRISLKLQDQIQLDDDNNKDNNKMSSKWNFYHDEAISLLNERIGFVIKCIYIYNYYDEIDPYLRWEADIFKWKESDNNDNDDNGDTDDDILKCIEYDTHKYGIDDEPGKNSAMIKKYDNIKPMVLEGDFGIRIFKSYKNDDDDDDDDNNNKKEKRTLCGQLILHAHFINLNNENKIEFNKNEIDFVYKDKNHKSFPKDFQIVIKGRILRKK